MNIIKEEKLNGGPASCPPERQETSKHEDKLKKITLTTHRINPYTKAKEAELLKKEYLPANTYAPFRTLQGFHTSQGIITPLMGPIRGYVLEDSQWILYAAPNQDCHYQPPYKLINLLDPLLQEINQADGTSAMHHSSILPRPAPLPYHTSTGNQMTSPTCHGRLTTSHHQSIPVPHHVR